LFYCNLHSCSWLFSTRSCMMYPKCYSFLKSWDLSPSRKNAKLLVHFCPLLLPCSLGRATSSLQSPIREQPNDTWKKVGNTCYLRSEFSLEKLCVDFLDI
jgi:hypothetical protein